MALLAPSPRAGRLHQALGALLVLTAAAAAQAKDVNAMDFGLRSDPAALNTEVLQRAIDAAADGGGCVLVPPGTYPTGPLHLHSHVTLRLETGATLLAVSSPAAFAGHPAFIEVTDCDDAAIDGGGTIDGNGTIFPSSEGSPSRPKLVILRRSHNVSVRDVSLVNPGSWTLHIDSSEGVVIRGVRIHSQTNTNNDGIDVDGRNIVISDCIIDAEDDGICLKSRGSEPCENVSISNCVVASTCNLIKLGTESVTGFRNIAISNCVLHAPSEDRFHHWPKRLRGLTDPVTGIGGISLETVDGATLEGVVISNISMVDVQTPIFIRLGQRRGPHGTLHRVSISHVVANGESLLPSMIVGVPGSDVEDVQLSDIQLSEVGGGTAADAHAAVEEHIKSYPDNRMFGQTLPAYGLYLRHARGISLDHVRISLRQPDGRPAIVADDVHDLALSDWTAAAPTGAEPLVRLVGCSDTRLSGFHSPTPIAWFLDTQSMGARSVVLRENDFRNVDLHQDGKADATSPFIELNNLK